MATHCGDILAHRVDPSDRSALSDMERLAESVPEATPARVPIRTRASTLYVYGARTHITLRLSEPDCRCGSA